MNRILTEVTTYSRHQTDAANCRHQTGTKQEFLALLLHTNMQIPMHQQQSQLDIVGLIIKKSFQLFFLASDCSYSSRNDSGSLWISMHQQAQLGIVSEICSECTVRRSAQGQTTRRSIWLA
jgi:hypothetical protein